jgi:hypothetical protein
MTMTGGSYTVPDATNGRSTMTVSMSYTEGANTETYTGTSEIYVIDANRMFMINTSDHKASSADVRKQLNTSTYTVADFTGSFVTYEEGYQLKNSVYSYYSMLVQASSSESGASSVNQIYEDNNGTYSAGQGIGSTSTVSFDSNNPGRATITVAGSSDTMIAYYFNTGSGFMLDFNGSDSYLATGWTEPQTQTTFTNAAIAGAYLIGSMQPMQAVQDGSAGEFDVLNNGTISANMSEADDGYFTWNQPATWSYSWDTSTTGTGTFLVTGTGDTGGDSCAVISSSKIVCTPNADSWPGIAIIQQ